MTKERKLAIQMWEEIAQQHPDSVYEYKDSFCKEHDLDWQNDCWLCQYVRQDYRADLPSREGFLTGYNRCQKCPIYKYNRCTGDECGCEPKSKESVFMQARFAVDPSDRQEAAKTIARLLKGEKLWVIGEE